MAHGTDWSWEETLMAFALYFITGPSPRKKDPNVVALANSLERTPDAVRYKIGNIAAKDKNWAKAGWKKGSKYDRLVWEEYEERGDELLGEALNAFTAAIVGQSSDLENIDYDLIDYRSGEERVVRAKQRINQDYFRSILLENYSKRCCITGINMAELLVASHIKPWRDSDPKTERLAPSNGLLLNTLHDKAFDEGLITIDTKHIVRVSKKVKKTPENQQFLWSIDRQPIQLPLAHTPAKRFIEYHNDVIFKG